MTTPIDPAMRAAVSRRDFLNWSAALALGAVASGPAAAAVASVAAPGAPLRFALEEAGVEHHFFRRGPVATHLQANPGVQPRLIFAFPAGNTGIALWFDSRDAAAVLGLAPETALEGVERADGMRGVTAHLRSAASRLDIGAAVLANIRVLRDYVTSGGKTLPASVASRIERTGGPAPGIAFRRTTLEGRHHMELTLLPANGTRVVTQDGRDTLLAGPDGQIHVVATALTDYAAPTPYPMGELLTGDAADRPRDRDALAFLASQEYFAAGSWRFLTYFGRDTLLSLSMLMPVLQPGAIEGALGSVLERLRADGAVAHEDVIGEFAVQVNGGSPHPPADPETPFRDYKMVDTDFILAPVLATYLLDTPAGRARAGAFLARRTTGGQSYLARVSTNLERVMRLATPYAEHAHYTKLIALADNADVGNCRDSNNGLGGGRYPYDVNVALVPAALRAAGRLYRSGLLGQHPAAAERAARLLPAWSATRGLFAVTVPAENARTLAGAYARDLNLDAAAATSAISGPVRYDAVALGLDGKPVRVMHSDSSFVLQFDTPEPAYLDAVAAQLTMPFPAGLRTDVGIVVANPAYGFDATRRLFTRNDYHGTVVWSWQQAMLASGLRRQLARTDLPAATRAALRGAEDTLWATITAMDARSSGELWSWAPRNGKAALAKWVGRDGDESCAAQLWSTVYLAVKPPG